MVNYHSLLSNVTLIVFIPFRNHSWVSFSGFSEAYNEVFSQEVEKFREFVSDISGKHNLVFPDRSLLLLRYLISQEKV